MIGFLDGWQESLLITVGQLIKFLASSPTCNPIDTLRLRWQEKQKYQATLKFSPKVSKRFYLHAKQNRSKVSSCTNLQ